MSGHKRVPAPPARIMPFNSRILSSTTLVLLDKTAIMRILVTGGAGFIGSNFIHSVSKLSSSPIALVRVLDNLTYAGSLDNLKGVDLGALDFIQGDICNPAVVMHSTKNIDVVIHFAAESHVDRSITSPKIFTTTNVLGTHVLLEACLKNNVSTFIHISTDEVYGSIQEGSWNEDCVLLPNSPYAASKASAELIAMSYFRTYGLDIRVIRCSNNYGPRQNPEKFIPRIITNLLMGKRIPIYGDGRNIREWIHVNDHCRAIMLVLEFGKAGDVYNIGSGFEKSNIEVAGEVIKALNLEEDMIEFVQDRKGHDFRYSVDWSRSRETLGFLPGVDFNSGIEATIQWYISNQTWWRSNVQSGN